VKAEELLGAERVVEQLLDSVGIRATWRSCRIALRPTELPHSASGLMRAIWSNETILANRLDDWGFSAQRPVKCGRPLMRARPAVK
jgi:hypothetical protein